MIQSFVKELVLEALHEVQALGGHTWQGLPVGSAAIGSLEGFDSLTGIEATVIVEKKLSTQLGRPVALPQDTIFVSSNGRKALTLGDVVATVCAALATK